MFQKVNKLKRPVKRTMYDHNHRLDETHQYTKHASAEKQQYM